MDKTNQCPVCENHSLDTYDQYEICEICEWEDCGYMRDNPDESSGANWLTLNQARTNWKEHGVVMTKKDYEDAIASAQEAQK